MTAIVFTGGVSQEFLIKTNTGVSVCLSNVSGVITFRLKMPDESTVNLKNNGTDISYTADFQEIIQVRSGDILSIVQTGGAPENTLGTVNGWDYLYKKDLLNA